MKKSLIAVLAVLAFVGFVSILSYFEVLPPITKITAFGTVIDFQQSGPKKLSGGSFKNDYSFIINRDVIQGSIVSADSAAATIDTVKAVNGRGVIYLKKVD